MGLGTREVVQADKAYMKVKEAIWKGDLLFKLSYSHPAA